MGLGEQLPVTMECFHTRSQVGRVLRRGRAGRPAKMRVSQGSPEPMASEVMSRLLLRVLLLCSLLSGKMAWLFLREEGTSRWLMSAALSSR